MNNHTDITISFIIPSYNSFNTINFTIDSLLKHNSDQIFEIIIVESSDSDQMDQLIKQYHSNKIKLVVIGTRVIPATGRNIGANTAKGNVLIFLDADVIVSPEYIATIIKYIEEGVLVGGGGVEIPVFQRKNPIVIAQYLLQLSEYIPSGKDRIKTFLPGCNIFCRREVFEKSGGFPSIRACEDVIWGLNVSKFEKIWFLPELVVYHIFSTDFRRMFNNQILLGRYAGILKGGKLFRILKNKFLLIILSPVLFSIKLLLISHRVLKAGFTYHCYALRGFPYLMLGVLFWTIGFIQGCSEMTIENTHAHVAE